MCLQALPDLGGSPRVAAAPAADALVVAEGGEPGGEVNGIDTPDWEAEAQAAQRDAEEEVLREVQAAKSKRDALARPADCVSHLDDGEDAEDESESKNVAKVEEASFRAKSENKSSLRCH